MIFIIFLARNKGYLAEHRQNIQVLSVCVTQKPHKEKCDKDVLFFSWNVWKTYKMYID